MAACKDITPNLFDIFCLGAIMRECIIGALLPPLTADSTEHECLALINESFHPYYKLAMKCILPIENRITIDQFREEMCTLPETITHHDGSILTTNNYVKPWIAPPNTTSNYKLIFQPTPDTQNLPTPDKQNLPNPLLVSKNKKHGDSLK